MDDIRDIILRVIKFNENTSNSNPFLIKNMIASDINSLYDNINQNDTNYSYNYAINKLLPIGYIDNDSINLWYKASNFLFENAYFNYNGNIYKITNSQIQGTKSGGDCCMMVLNVMECKYKEKSNELLALRMRYKDDLYMIPKIEIRNETELNEKILSVLYPGFEFESSLNEESGEICDVEIYTTNFRTLETRSIKDKKIRSYVNKSSNTKQNINSITKTLQERYIIINSTKENYIKTKSITYNILTTKCEWTAYDLRKTQHLNYNLRYQLLNKYKSKKAEKMKKYRNMIKINLNNNKWWESTKIEKEINGYITYQKTLCDEDEMNKILKECINELPNDMKTNYKVNLYWKYQPPLRKYI